MEYNNLDADLSFRIYERTIPKEVYEKLNDLYESAYCVKDYFYTYESFDNLNALVISLIQNPVHVIIFTIKNSRVQILNRLYSMDAKYIGYVTRILFSKYKNIVRIDFRGIYKTRFGDVEMPHLISHMYKDIVLDLPGNLELYCSRLSKKTRRNIKYYARRLNNTFKNVNFEVRIGSDIDIDILRQIIAFNRLRMIRKGHKPGIDKDYEGRICEFSKSYGYVGLITMNNNLCAGVIFSKVGRQVYLHVLSHDTNYDKYDLGTLCLFYVIKYCIEIKVHTLHFLWGESEYKYRFLGYDREVCDIAIFRNNLHKMLNYYEIFAYIKSLLHAKLISSKHVRACYKKLMQIKRPGKLNS